MEAACRCERSEGARAASEADAELEKALLARTQRLVADAERDGAPDAVEQPPGERDDGVLAPLARLRRLRLQARRGLRLPGVPRLRLRAPRRLRLEVKEAPLGQGGPARGRGPGRAWGVCEGERFRAGADRR